MDELIDLLGDHYQWLLSGVGVALLLGLWKARRSPPHVSQRQRGGAFSRNVQVANVGAGDRDHDAE